MTEKLSRERIERLRLTLKLLTDYDSSVNEDEVDALCALALSALARPETQEADSITEQMIDAALAAGHGLLVDTREFWTDEDRKIVRGMMEAGMRAVGRLSAETQEAPQPVAEGNAGAQDILSNLVEQIKRCAPVDSLGHAFKMNQAYITAQVFLTRKIAPAPSAPEVAELVRRLRERAAEFADSEVRGTTTHRLLNEAASLLERSGARWIPVSEEVERARAKHPIWPTDILHAAAIVAEESGELMRAAVQHRGEGGTLEACDKEAIQTAATCIRFLERK
jgi:hypothetical protein